MRIAILISGRGSNMEAIINSIKIGSISGAEIGVVLSNRENAAGLKTAKNEGIKALYLDPGKFVDRDEYDLEIVNVLKQENIELICLAGFMRIISSRLIKNFPNRILNVHPSLLPSFPGLDAQRQALGHGVKISGVTVHIVDEGVDTGPIVMQKAVNIEEGDTIEILASKILCEEHKIYPLAVKAFVEGRVEVEGRRVIIV